MLRLEGVHKSFGKLHVLRGVDLDVDRGAVVCVIGPSGGGKSTFIRLLMAEELPTAGRVFIDEQDPAHVRPVAHQADRMQDQLAKVDRPRLGEQAIVIGEETRKLDLLLSLGTVGVALRGPSERFRPPPVLRGCHHLVLEAVDALDQARQKPGRIAAHVVMAERQIVEAVDQQGEPVCGCYRMKEGIKPRLGRFLPQKAGAERVERGAPELLVGQLDQLFGAAPHLRCRLGREGERQYVLGRCALLGKPGDARCDYPSLAGTGAGDDEERAARMGDGLKLRIA
jgi:energy-coupling factor transporter ATP-binding protein EcfA2